VSTEGNRKKSSVSSYSSADHVRLTIPVPPVGQVVEFTYEARNLRILIERMAPETQEQLRERYVVVAPVGNDNRTHACRMGSGTISPKKMGVTICREGKSDPLPSGNRINGLQLEHVTCDYCIRKLTSEGVELKTEERK
jgi:hypothetical protein